MKKWLLVVVSLLMFVAVVEAGCGSDACGAAKDAKDKAACSLKSKSCDDAAVCDVKGTCKAEVAGAKKSCGKADAKPCDADKETKKSWWKFWSK